MFSLVAIGADNRLLYEKVFETAESNAELATKKCTKMFLDALLDLEPFFLDLLAVDRSDPPTEADYDNFFSCTSCVICEKR